MRTGKDIYIILLLIMLTFLGCEKNEEVKEYTLDFYYKELRYPNNVNIMFQVSDRNNEGVTNLGIEDFELSENEELLSIQKSHILLRKKNDVNYNMKTILLIQNSDVLDSNIEYVKQAAHVFVDNMFPKQEVAIYVFSDKIDTIHNFTSDTESLNRAIDNITLGTSYACINKAIKSTARNLPDIYALSEVQQSFVVLLSNGNETCDLKIMYIPRNKSHERVFAVGVNSNYDRENMESLGTAGFYTVNDYSEIANAFVKIQKKIEKFSDGFYWISYYSEKRGDNLVELDLTIKGNRNIHKNAKINAGYYSKGFYTVEPGIFINRGLDSLIIDPGDSYNLFASTHAPHTFSLYSWQVEDNNIISLTVDEANPAKATIKALGSEGHSTIVTVNDKANNFDKSVFITIKKRPVEPIVDGRDGQVYNTVKIGSQVWMSENMRYKPEDVQWYEEELWGIDTLPPDTIYKDMRYGWSTAQYVCPEGWHLPSNEEWNELEEYMIANGYNYDGSKTGNKIGKALASKSDWSESLKTGDVGNNQATNNSSGFNATMEYPYKIISISFWSSTEYDGSSVYVRNLYCRSQSFYNSISEKQGQNLVRCLRD